MSHKPMTKGEKFPRIRLGNRCSARHLPLALADQHRLLPVGAVVRAALDPRPTPGWGSQLALDLAIGAGFASIGPVLYKKEVAYLTLERLHSLPDTVASGMKLLIVGLNPSPYSADTGIGYARPGNRFWPAALQAGIASIDRDPWHALRHHGLGMTDLVRRTTRRADEVSAKEYQEGFARVTRLAQWLSPRAVCFVGLGGWRNIVDAKAKAGVQASQVGCRPVYLMPHTSGLNAHCRLEDLARHFACAASLAMRS